MNHIANLLEDINTDDFFSSESPKDTSDTVVNPEPLANVVCDEDIHASSTQTIDTDQMRTMIMDMQGKLSHMLSLLDGASPPLDGSAAVSRPAGTSTPGTVLEGVFDGQQMIGQDGNTYAVPPNYASKSKLVEGDMMKLTITPAGQYRFKQIGPIVRKHVIGELMFDAAINQWRALADGRMYKVLTASVTFHKGDVGKKVSLIVPEDGESEWGAIENLVA